MVVPRCAVRVAPATVRQPCTTLLPSRFLSCTTGGLLGQRGAPVGLQYRRAVRRRCVQPPLRRRRGVLHHAAGCTRRAQGHGA